MSSTTAPPREPLVAVGVGVALCLVGLASFLGTGTSSVTALIPLFFGLPIAALGWLARSPARLRLCMHLVAALALLGLLGTLNVLPALSDLVLGKQPPGSAAAILARGAMLLLCGGLLAVCVASFVRVRRQRRG